MRTGLRDCSPCTVTNDANVPPISSNQRTLLLFVIRDHIGTTPLANLQATLTADLQRIWDSLSKPEELANCKLEDYFDLAFTALPHKILAADKFEEEVRRLRGRFVEKGRDDFLFKPAYHKRIPADGVAFYMENIWVRLKLEMCIDVALVLMRTTVGTSANEQGPRPSNTAGTISPVPLRRNISWRLG